MFSRMRRNGLKKHLPALFPREFFHVCIIFFSFNLKLIFLQKAEIAPPKRDSCGQVFSTREILSLACAPSLSEFANTNKFKLIQRFMVIAIKILAMPKKYAFSKDVNCYSLSKQCSKKLTSCNRYHLFDLHSPSPKTCPFCLFYRFLMRL